ncbi:unnamed protein product [Phytomonas sp. Hart1]|nr:unnamed protein product [Phytomonas sp. Hart1]|eukprot:CCW66861.1 unnamed protein product [Phytomonas sp. isolate Hart1]
MIDPTVVFVHLRGEDDDALMAGLLQGRPAAKKHRAVGAVGWDQNAFCRVRGEKGGDDVGKHAFRGEPASAHRVEDRDIHTPRPRLHQMHHKHIKPRENQGVEGLDRVLVEGPTGQSPQKHPMRAKPPFRERRRRHRAVATNRDPR